GRIGWLAVVAAGRSGAGLMLSVSLVAGGLAVPGAILGSLGASLAEAGIGRFYVRPSLSGRLPFPARELLSYAGFLFLSGVSMTLYNRLDLFMLKLLGGTAAEAGIYGVAQNLAAVPTLFAFAISSVLLSTLSRVLRTGDSPLAKKMGANVMRVVIGLLPFAGLTAGAASEVIGAIFSP